MQAVSMSPGEGGRARMQAVSMSPGEGGRARMQAVSMSTYFPSSGFVFLSSLDLRRCHRYPCQGAEPAGGHAEHGRGQHLQVAMLIMAGGTCTEEIAIPREITADNAPDCATCSTAH
ncbi:hypothetical protein ACOMHN_003659 [Nucella lapillus]